MLQLLHNIEGLEIFEYVTWRAGGACLTAFILSLVFGGRVIRMLLALKAGQPIRNAAEVHKLAELHGGKVGTPTMGGVLILGTIILSALLWTKFWENPFIQVLLFIAVTHGFLGFRDDYLKVKKKTSEGVSARFKISVQFSSAALAACFLFFHWDPAVQDYMRLLYIPVLKEPLIIWGIVGVILFVVVVIGCSNAVNLTDGLDGLATGCMIIATITFSIFAYVIGHAQHAEYVSLTYNRHVSEVTIFCLAIVGSGLGFLWFNSHPAKVFMGDTGSLALGGLLGGIALCTRQEILLVIVGGVFVMEAASVILQVASFKLRGKRIFRMAPIHHHFELKGWKESEVIVRFWILAIMFALLGLATLKIR